MERIFNNSQITYGVLGQLPAKAGAEDDLYIWTVRALIADAVDYEESELAPFRELAQDYYYGNRPNLLAEEEEEITGDPPVDDDATASRSTVVSRDVQDTILSVMPSMMRIFAGSEHAVEFKPNGAKDVDMAKQATDYIRKKFWDEWDGFNILYSAIWDAAVNKVGIVTWGTNTVTQPRVQTYNTVTQDGLAGLLNQVDLNPELLEYGKPYWHQGVGDYVVDGVKIRTTKSVPETWLEGIPPEDFRISRSAKSLKTARLAGFETVKTVGELVEMGYSFDEVAVYASSDYSFSVDRQIRNPGSDTFYPLNDLVKYGCFWVRIDKNGDGINELRRIETIGENYDILDDNEVDDIPPLALFKVDIRPHTALGNALSELAMDIQRIKTNLIRGGLDSLTQSIWPRTVFNPIMTETEDVMSDDIGSPIRTRGNPAEAIYESTTPFVGKEAFDAAVYVDNIRVQRTGLSDASKGIDPKAFQSTNLTGIDAILSGAQERIELIARTLAENGVKQMYQGLLREVVNNPNPDEMIEVNGGWVPVDPSGYDPNMRTVVNPMLGKGTDMTRLLALKDIAAAQMAVIEKFGLGNGVVGIQELRNTQVDMMALVNVKNDTRYFKQPTPQQIKAMESAPKEPSPELLLAQSQLENVKSKTADAVAKNTRTEQKDAADDDFRRDKLAVDSLVQILSIFKDIHLANEAEAEVLAEDRKDANHGS